jgi:hypothetical protein
VARLSASGCAIVIVADSLSAPDPSRTSKWGSVALAGGTGTGFRHGWELRLPSSHANTRMSMPLLQLCQRSSTRPLSQVMSSRGAGETASMNKAYMVALPSSVAHIASVSTG